MEALLLLLLMGLVPLIAFAISDAMGRLRTGVALAIALALGETIFMYNYFGRIDPVSVSAFIFISVLGFFTLRFEKSIYIKYQPVVVGAFSGVLMGYVQLVGPTVMERYGEFMASHMPPLWAENFANQVVLDYLDQLFLAAAPVFLIHAAWMAWAAKKCSVSKWIMVRAVGFWTIMVPLIFIMGAIFRANNN